MLIVKRLAQGLPQYGQGPILLGAVKEFKCCHQSRAFKQTSSKLEELYREVLDQFPKQRCLVFAYGSGVFQQANSEMSQNMTDFIIGVTDSQSWHRENLARHGSHYSDLARLAGPGRVAAWQEEFGAGLYFNTLVPWGDKGRIKYGVIQRDHLEDDLLTWRTLYGAGRLHKPVKLLECEDSLKPVLNTNLHSALTTALLLLPEQFTEEQLYLSLASISYTGDFRMVVGEDKNKVANIVRPQIERFRRLYRGVLSEFSSNLYYKDGIFSQNTEIKKRKDYILRLPSNLQKRIDLMKLTESKDHVESVRKAISEIVASTDKSQALKGILTAGPVKATHYSLTKLRKMLRSKAK